VSPSASAVLSILITCLGVGALRGRGLFQQIEGGLTVDQVIGKVADRARIRIDERVEEKLVPRHSDYDSLDVTG
jgi:hypothetical protein